MNAATLSLPATKPVVRARRFWGVAIGVAVLLSIGRAGLDPSEVVNRRGWSQVSAFIRAMVSPELSGDFLRLTLRESAVTASYALLGTAVALVIGLIGGVLLTERLWAPLSGFGDRPSSRLLPSPPRVGWGLTRLLFAIPRSVHEVVFGLLLVNILGLDPLVAVLAIGIPFGAVTAKVFSELLDEVPASTDQVLRASGAGRFTALVFGIFPAAFGDLLSYSFYRLECAIRSAAVLGIIGAGGLGFQLALSFQSLRYNEMWTLLWALVIISGLADRWSSLVRRRRNSAAVEMHLDRGTTTVAPRQDPVLRASVFAATALIPISLLWLDIDVRTIWSQRARTLGRELVSDAWPPEIGVGGWGGLITDGLDTIALAVLSIAIAWTGASVIAFLAARRVTEQPSTGDRVLAVLGLLTRFVLLVARSVPPPVWAFIVVFVVFPGLWPGAIALGLYNLGVLGRLQSEVVENVDDRPAQVLRAAGAGAVAVAAYSTLPAVSGRFVSLGLYRWEVAIRETVIVGVVGAAGLGRRLDEQTSSFDYDGILATIVTLIVVTVAVDLAGAAIRRSLR